MKHGIPIQYYKNIIAGLVVICMFAVEISMFGMSPGYYVISEEHEMDIFMADGQYDGKDSDDPISKEYDVIVKEIEETQHPFNILEILPTVKKGVIGYTIAGLEPFEKEDGSPIRSVRDSDGTTILATESQIREAYMDAVINAHPGVNGANKVDGDDPQLIRDIVGNMSSKLRESGTSEAFIIDANQHTFNGYYKYVGTDKGVFAKGDEKEWSEWTITGKDQWGNDKWGWVNHKDREMFSRFYNYDSNRKYDYIFVYSNDETGDPTKDISVKDHRRIKYENNDRFLKDCLGINEDGIEDWRSNHEIEVSTRDPHSVSLQDIEKADLIVINNGNNMDYHKYALEIYNLTHQYKWSESDRDLDLDNDVVFSATNDFDSVEDENDTTWPGFEKSIRIYERVAVREDAAFITSKNCIDGHVFDTNIRKLMCMLFYVRDDKNNEYVNGKRLGDMAGSGREFFMDLMKRYVSEPGNYKVGIGVNRHKTYWDLRQENDRYMCKTLRDDRSHNYMHHDIPGVEIHPGHPLTTNIKDARTGGYFDDDGILVDITGETDPGNVIRRMIRRSSPQYYRDLGIKPRSPQDLEDYKPWINYNPDDFDPQNGYYKEPNVTAYDSTLGYDKTSTHMWCLDGYESMSNATDYIYIADDGTLVRDAKFSGDNGYWYKIDQDDGNGWNAFKKLKWDAKTWDSWPWNEKMEPWLFQKDTYERTGSDKGNLHLEYDYYDENYQPYKYRGLSDIDPGSAKFKNQNLLGQNEMLKADYIKNVLQDRKVKRENQIEQRELKKEMDCYVSMNILNGDGVNNRTLDASKKNKILYYNAYESAKIIEYENANPTKARIPIRIRIKTSCPLASITVSDKDGDIATYTYNDSNRNVGKKSNGTYIEQITCTSDKGKELILDRPEDSYRSSDKVPIKKDDDGNEVEDKTKHGDYIYTYEGLIYDVTHDKYLGRLNEEVTVTLTVSDQNNDPKTITDKITIVRRDYFMLN